MCSGVVPQQPPMRATPSSSTKRRCHTASSSGSSGYSVRPSTSIGRPALGMTEMGPGQRSAR